MPITETLTAITTGLASLRPRKQPNIIGTSATTDLAKQLDILLQEIASDPSINPTYARDIEQLLTTAIHLATQLSNPSFNFDQVIGQYTAMQTVSSILLRHAAGSRPRINGWGLTHNDKVFPYFAMSAEEAGRMRDGMSGLPLNVVAVEITHNLSFAPLPPIPVPAPVVAEPPAEPVPIAPAPAPASAPIPVVDAVPAPPAGEPQPLPPA